MKKSLLYILPLSIVLSFVSCNSNSNDSTEQAKDANDQKDSSGAMYAMDKSDADFMVDAANAGMMEIELGTSAQQRGMDQSVKNYGSMMVRDHSKANEQLRSLATQKDVIIPASMGEHHQKMVNDIREEKDNDFDKKYIDMMVSDHKSVISKFEDIAENGKDAELKAWASTTLATLRMHLDSAQYINDRLKDKK